MFNFSTLPPLSLYIHFPWCVRKCPYCDFNSHEVKDSVPEQEYVAALVRDLENDLPLIWGRRVNHIFMGGGTPSLFSPESLDVLLSELRARLQIKPEAEVTLEANPGTIDQKKFSEFRSLGINRLSVGVQSFDDDCLQRLGRIHDSKEAITAIEAAQQAGFDNLNIDLMFGLPGQDQAMAALDIKTAIGLNPQHLSYYQLTIEPNTFYFSNTPVLPKEDLIDSLQIENQSRLADAGYKQYEVSAYARDGAQCEHNRNYWRFGDYLGIGAGAHAKISNANEQSINRYFKLKHPRQYIEKTASLQHIGGENKLSRTEAGFEFMLNALRLADGFETSLFQESTGLPILVVEKQLKQAKLQGLLEWDRDYIRPTERGRLFLNDLLEIFI